MLSIYVRVYGHTDASLVAGRRFWFWFPRPAIPIWRQRDKLSALTYRDKQCYSCLRSLLLIRLDRNLPFRLIKSAAIAVSAVIPEESRNLDNWSKNPPLAALIALWAFLISMVLRGVNQSIWKLMRMRRLLCSTRESRMRLQLQALNYQGYYFAVFYSTLSALLYCVYECFWFLWIASINYCSHLKYLLTLELLIPSAVEVFPMSYYWKTKERVLTS